MARFGPGHGRVTSVRCRVTSLASAAPRIEQLFDELADLRQQLIQHPIYESINTLPRVRAFMEQHVYAVWDFMSLLKRLQQILTCTATPWLPPADPVMARFINEIVLAEESDEDGQGSYASHFELYLQAMRECAAQTHSIERFVTRLRAGASPFKAMQLSGVCTDTAEFVQSNIALAAHGAPHEVAAVFCLGREDIIPEMFQNLLPQLRGQGHTVDRLMYYIERHIHLDADEHGPLSKRLLEHLCGEDEIRWVEATIAAKQALQGRIRLWDGTLSRILDAE